MTIPRGFDESNRIERVHKAKLTAEKLGLIKSASVDYMECRKTWYCSYTLIIDGYKVSGGSKGHATFDEAAASLKDLMAKAVKDFDKQIN